MYVGLPKLISLVKKVPALRELNKSLKEKLLGVLIAQASTISLTDHEKKGSDYDNNPQIFYDPDHAN